MRRNFALLIILAITFLGPFGGNMILPMFTPLRHDFKIDVLVLGLTITLYMIPFSIFQFFSGSISDAIGSRRDVIIFGMMLYGLGALAAASSFNIYTFLISRVLQGSGNAFSLPIAMALVGDLFSKNIRGKIMGLVAISTTLGATIGPLFGGFISLINWRIGFVLLTSIAIGLGILVYLAIPKKIYKQNTYDASSVLSIIILSLHDIRVLVLSFLGFALFFIRIGLFTYLTDLLTLPPYKYGSDVIAGYLSLAGMGGLISGGIAGILTDRVGRIQTAMVGLGSLIPIFIAYLTTYWVRYLAFLLFFQGFFTTIAFTAINTIVVEINPTYRATITSIYSSFRFLGYALGPMLLYPAYKFGHLAGVVLSCIIILILGLLIFYKIKIMKKH